MADHGWATRRVRSARPPTNQSRQIASPPSLSPLPSPCRPRPARSAAVAPRWMPSSSRVRPISTASPADLRSRRGRASSRRRPSSSRVGLGRRFRSHASPRRGGRRERWSRGTPQEAQDARAREAVPRFAPVQRSLLQVVHAPRHRHPGAGHRVRPRSPLQRSHLPRQMHATVFASLGLCYAGRVLTAIAIKDQLCDHGLG